MRKYEELTARERVLLDLYYCGKPEHDLAAQLHYFTSEELRNFRTKLLDPNHDSDEDELVRSRWLTALRTVETMGQMPAPDPKAKRAAAALIRKVSRVSA